MVTLTDGVREYLDCDEVIQTVRKRRSSSSSSSGEAIKTMA